MNLVERIVALDVGNSAVKVLVTEPSPNFVDSHEHHQRRRGSDPPPGVSARFDLNRDEWQRDLCAWVDSVCSLDRTSWWVSTVNHAASDPLSESVGAFFGDRMKQWQTITFGDVPMPTEVQFPERLGIDRLVGAFAAFTRFPTSAGFSGPLVVVDAGSAVTVDLVRRETDGRAVFAGGAILPGIHLQRASLVTGPEGLRRRPSSAPGRTPISQNRVAPKQPIDPSVSEDTEGRSEVFGQRTDRGLEPGRNTEQAIETGVMAAVVGAVDRLAEEYANEYAGHDQALVSGEKSADSAQPLLVVSGGDGPSLSRFLRSKHVLVPNLVCLGSLEVAMQQCQSATGGLE